MLSVATCSAVHEPPISEQRWDSAGGMSAAVRRGDRERERRARALLDSTPDPAAVLLDDVASDRQAEAGAPAARERARSTL